MDQESRVLLEKTYKLVEENNKLLHKIRKVQTRQAFWSTLKVVVFIGFTLGAIYWIQPYLETILKAYNQIPGMKTQIDPNVLQKLVR